MESVDLRTLWTLIAQRTVAGADTAAIDQQIWDRFGAELSIMWTDLSGFSRQVARYGIVHFLQTIYEQKRVLLPIVESHAGALVKIEADSLLLVFPAPATALACAIEMQRACHELNLNRPPEDHMILCVGIGHGRLLKVGDDEVFGHEVNMASKLGEDTAKPHEILVTPAARQAIVDAPGVTWEEVRAEYAGESMCWRARY